MGDSLGDLAHLLLSDCQAAHGLLRVDIDAKLIKQLLCFFIHLLIVDELSIHVLTADKNVLSYGQMTHHVQLLVHNNDTCILGLSRIGEFYFLTLIGNGSRILMVNTCQNLHQS